MRPRDLVRLQWLISFFGFALLLIFSSTLNLGCSSKDPGVTPVNPPPQPFSSETTPPPVVEPVAPVPFTWSLKFLNECEGSSVEKCWGAYPFFVFDDHSYQVGPGPDGQFIEGWLDESEFKILNEKVAQYLANGTAVQESPTCEGLIQLQVKRGGKEVCHVLSETTLGAAAEETATASRTALQRELQGVAKKYYPVPFPSNCVDSAWAFEKMTESMQQCTRDLDCGYIDQNYDVIPVEESRSVATEDCSGIRPLLVANVFELVGQQRQLLLAREIVKDYCKASPSKPNCHKKSGFNTNGTAPVCVAGRCQIHPSLTKK